VPIFLSYTTPPPPQPQVARRLGVRREHAQRAAHALLRHAHPQPDEPQALRRRGGGLSRRRVRHTRRLAGGARAGRGAQRPRPGERERETERERERQTETETEKRETETETERERQRDRETLSHPLPTHVDE
jgi:hypothetical protein